MEVKVLYGSSNGNTESAAKRIASRLRGKALAVANASASDLESGFLILGSSTWGLGELQDDWAAKIQLLDGAAFKGRKAAVFGLGDQCGFPSTFVDAMGILGKKLEESGAQLIGAWSSAGYKFEASAAERSPGEFLGLALDEDNEAQLSQERIERWCAQIEKELA
jgi:flavodoxin I